MHALLPSAFRGEKPSFFRVLIWSMISLFLWKLGLPLVRGSNPRDWNKLNSMPPLNLSSALETNQVIIWVKYIYSRLFLVVDKVSHLCQWKFVPVTFNNLLSGHLRLANTWDTRDAPKTKWWFRLVFSSLDPAVETTVPQRAQSGVVSYICGFPLQENLDVLHFWQVHLPLSPPFSISPTPKSHSLECSCLSLLYAWRSRQDISHLPVPTHT